MGCMVQSVGMKFQFFDVEGTAFVHQGLDVPAFVRQGFSPGAIHQEDVDLFLSPAASSIFNRAIAIK